MPDLVKELQQPLLASLQKLDTSVSTLSLLQLVNEFYSPDERREMYAKYQALLDADAECYRKMIELQQAEKALPAAADDEEAKALREEKMQAFDDKQKSSQQASAFRREHPLIVRVLEAKARLSKGPHE